MQTPQRRSSAREWLGKPADCPLAAFVGAFGFDSRKGFDTLWAAWQKLCARPDWDIDLLAVGAGRALPAWRSRVAESGLASRVLFLGHSDRIDDVLAASDLLIRPSGMSPTASMFTKRYAAEFRQWSAPTPACRALPGDLGDLLIPVPTDVDGLVARMLGWRSTMNVWKQRVAPLARQLRMRTWETMSQDIVAIVEGVLPAAAPAVSSNEERI